MESKLFTALFNSENAQFLEAKAEMSAAFLKPSAVVHGSRAFRASAASVKTQNVVGVGIDEKYVDGIPTGVKAIKFLVKSKAAPSAVLKSEMLPKSVSGFVTDVEEVGNLVPLAKRKASAAVIMMPNSKSHFRPAQPGSSIAFQDPANGFVMAGTFGLLVKDANNVKYVLSNNHFIAYESGVDANGATRIGVPIGPSIFQPGLLDGGQPTQDKIAELSRWSTSMRTIRTTKSTELLLS